MSGEERERRRWLSDDEREWLAEAFHAWDHAASDYVSCGTCIEFVDDFEPLISDIIAARLAPVESLAASLLHPWDSATGREIHAALGAAPRPVTADAVPAQAATEGRGN